MFGRLVIVFLSTFMLVLMLAIPSAAFAQDETSASELYDKGMVFYRLGQYEEAITYFDMAIEIDPNYIDALGDKAAALDFLGRYEEAITYNDMVLAIDPNDVVSLYNKGTALANLGQHEEALGMLRSLPEVYVERLKEESTPLTDPDLEKLRNDPTYGSQLKEIFQ